MIGSATFITAESIPAMPDPRTAAARTHRPRADATSMPPGAGIGTLGETAMLLPPCCGQAGERLQHAMLSPQPVQSVRGRLAGPGHGPGPDDLWEQLVAVQGGHGARGNGGHHERYGRHQ